MSRKAVLNVYRSRGDAASFSDRAYYVYAAFLVILMLGTPLAIGVVDQLMEPRVVAFLTGPYAVISLCVLGVVALIGAMGLGTVRGPVVMPPFLASVLGGSPIPQRQAFLGPFLGSVALAVAVLLVPSGLVAIALVRAGALSGGAGFLVVAGVVFFALLLSSMWLGGQVGAAPQFGRGRALILASSFRVPQLLSDLAPPTVLAQSQRWQAVTLSGATGDFAGAAMLYRPKPSAGRYWKTILALPKPLQFLIMDAVSAVRNPLRLTAASVGVVAAGAALGAVMGDILGDGGRGGSLVLVTAALCGVVLHMSSGVTGERFSDVAAQAQTPVLYREKPVTRFVLHAVFPLVWGVVLLALGALTTTGVGEAALIGVLMVPAVVLVRIYDAIKPPLPLVLFTPMESPAGDMSGMMVLLWQGDAVITTGIFTVIMTALVTAGSPFIALGVVWAVTLAVIGLMIWGRLRKL